MITKKSPEPRVRSLADASPDYAALDAKIRELKALSAKLDRERSELWAAANTGRDDGDDAVAALLGDASDASNPTRANARSRLAEIASEMAAVGKAIEVAEGRLRSARMGASAVVTDELRPVYREKVRAVAEALKVMLTASADYRAICADLNAADIAWTGGLRPLGVDRMIGDPRDRYGAPAQWFREAAEHGFITPAEIPETFR